MVCRPAVVSTMRTAAVGALLALATGCGSGSGGPTSHPTTDTGITAEVGERFTLTFDGENGSTRSHWYVIDPQPDASVVRSRGRDYEADEEGMVGGGGSLTFTFEAVGKGSTEIVVQHCTFNTCLDGTASPAAPSPSFSSSASASTSTSPSPAPEPERITYTVTVG